MQEEKKIRRSKKALLEAALFMSSDPLPMKKLVRILNKDIASTEKLLEELAESMMDKHRGVQLVETGEGYLIRVKPDYIKLVRNLAKFQDLRRGLLKVLALVAYRQPITQSDIVKIIGNRTYSYVKRLRQKGLIKAVKSGRTRALILTKGFAEYFGLDSIADAKKLFEGMDLGEVEKEVSKTSKTSDEKSEEGRSVKDSLTDKKENLTEEEASPDVSDTEDKPEKDSDTEEEKEKEAPKE